jgi:hypothetical protein
MTTGALPLFLKGWDPTQYPVVDKEIATLQGFYDGMTVHGGSFTGKFTGAPPVYVSVKEFAFHQGFELVNNTLYIFNVTDYNYSVFTSPWPSLQAGTYSFDYMVSFDGRPKIDFYTSFIMGTVASKTLRVTRLDPYDPTVYESVATQGSNPGPTVSIPETSVLFVQTSLVVSQGVVNAFYDHFSNASWRDEGLA